jgi:hypothetical protein
MSRRRTLFWWEAAAALLSLGLLVVTLISADWIEEVFGVDPDGGNGMLEWGIVIGLAVAALVSITLATREWRRLRAVRA